MGLTPLPSQPPSQPPPWITIDGPAGTGKTTTATRLAARLAAAGHRIHRTQQPSRGPFGSYVRHAIATLDGHPLAAVITADRYQHVHHEIVPALAAGATVICDRYVPSAALDILRGVPAEVVWAMHAALPIPTLAVVLDCDDTTAAARVAARGAHSRWQSDPANPRRERAAYRQIAQRLRQARWPLLTIDTTSIGPDEAAQIIADGLRGRSPGPTG